MAINTELAEVILDALRAAGYSCGIMGGYARDTFFGIQPKDLDICVAVGDQHDEADVECIISKISNILFAACYENKLHVQRQVMGMYNDHASDRACGVIKYEEEGIDVILYRFCEQNIDIINSFDFNLNQFGMDGKHDNIPVYLGNTDLRTLSPVREDASPERCLKVMGKHRNLLPAIERAYSEGTLV